MKSADYFPPLLSFDRDPMLPRFDVHAITDAFVEDFRDWGAQWRRID